MKERKGKEKRRVVRHRVLEVVGVTNGTERNSEKKRKKVKFCFPFFFIKPHEQEEKGGRKVKLKEKNENMTGR